MKNFLNKVKTWILTHKVISIVIAVVLVAGITLAIALPIALGTQKNDASNADKQAVVNDDHGASANTDDNSGAANEDNAAVNTGDNSGDTNATETPDGDNSGTDTGDNSGANDNPGAESSATDVFASAITLVERNKDSLGDWVYGITGENGDKKCLKFLFDGQNNGLFSVQFEKFDSELEFDTRENAATEAPTGSFLDPWSVEPKLFDENKAEIALDYNTSARKWSTKSLPAGKKTYYLTYELFKAAPANTYLIMNSAAEPEYEQLPLDEEFDGWSKEYDTLKAGDKLYLSVSHNEIGAVLVVYFVYGELTERNSDNIDGALDNSYYDLDVTINGEASHWSFAYDGYSCVDENGKEIDFDTGEYNIQFKVTIKKDFPALESGKKYKFFFTCEG